MSSTTNNSIKILVPYIRLTKNTENEYTLWVAVFIPNNYSIPNEPTVNVENPNLVQVNINAEGPEASPSSEWEVVPFKVSLPTPENGPVGDAVINTTVWLNDPENEGSTKIKYTEVEEG